MISNLETIKGNVRTFQLKCFIDCETTNKIIQFWIFRIISANDDEYMNATSSEILEDVLKQLDKLGSEKRNQILKKLKGSLPTKDVNNADDTVSGSAASSTTPKSDNVISTTRQDTESIQDEVEMLDLHEPKLGTYKRKRSESSLLLDFNKNQHVRDFYLKKFEISCRV